MTAAGPVVPEFPSGAAIALETTAARAGLSTRGARLIRLFATAVYYLPAAGAVARIAPDTAGSFTRLATSVEVTRWLARVGFPAVEPLPVEQPLSGHGCIVTFWKYLPQSGPEPTTADLGHLVRQFHQLPTPPVPLPAYQPLTSMDRAIQASRAISDDDRDWLGRYRKELLAAYAGLAFPLGSGVIHADAWRGNLLRAPGRVVLADWDTVSTGPRETDLIPTLQAPRFGLPLAERDSFVAAYGRDIRQWAGYPVLRDIRELSTLSALLRDGHGNRGACRELRTRLRSIRAGDNHRWASF
jgi:aminoglycoside phosphotransferase (APT) family kinase protein